MLSKAERLILFNQFEILKLLTQDETLKEEYEIKQNILYEGFEGEYNTLFFDDETVSKKVCDEVRSILYMFMCLSESYDNLQDKRDLETYDVMFQGFDGNDESDYYYYAKWIVKNNEFPQFAGCDMNSHSKKLSKYRTMLEKFNEVTSSEHQSFTNLSYEIIKHIIE